MNEQSETMDIKKYQEYQAAKLLLAEYDLIAISQEEFIELRAENLRLRNALTRIANSDGPHNITTGEGHSECVWAARRALTAGK
jgi:hypothetical protein